MYAYLMLFSHPTNSVLPNFKAYLHMFGFLKCLQAFVLEFLIYLYYMCVYVNDKYQ